jgi:hypothetical protein
LADLAICLLTEQDDRINNEQLRIND